MSSGRRNQTGNYTLRITTLKLAGIRVKCYRIELISGNGKIMLSNPYDAVSFEQIRKTAKSISDGIGFPVYFEGKAVIW